MTHIRTADWQSAIVAGYLAGRSVGDLGRTIGPSRSTVSRELVRLGHTLRPKGAKFLPQTVIIPADVAVLAYLAGLFDGEGNLYWRRRDRRQNGGRLTIYSTTADALNWLQATFGGFLRWDHIRVETRGWKPCGRWEVSRTSDVIALLKAMQPFLIIKRDLAATVIRDLSNPTR